MSLRLIRLREWKPTPVELDPEELADLQRIDADLVVTPSAGGGYEVRPGSIVGAATTPRLQVLIEPKFSIERVLYLVGSARRIRFQPTRTQLGASAELTEGFVAAFLVVVRDCLSRGLLKGYRHVDEQLAGVRGRVRFADQLRRQFALPLPVEVSYDNFTEDIEENRVLKAALRRLESFRPLSTSSHSRINDALQVMAGVSDQRYTRASVPNFRFSRLNERYRPALELASLVIANTSIDLLEGRREIRSFLFDMNQIFEDFVFEQLRLRLAPTMRPDYRWVQGEPLPLDSNGVLNPEPDLALWRGNRCLFVGDAKYKRTREGELGDLYQLLAYCTAADLDLGLLVYADQAGGSRAHRLVHGGPTLRVEGLDLEATSDSIADRLNSLARSIDRRAGRNSPSSPTHQARDAAPR